MRQTVLVTRTESVRTDTSRAYAAALDVQAEFERRLRDDPRFFLTEVFPYERPRGCESPPDTPVAVFHSGIDKRLSAEFPWVLPPTDPREPGADVSAADTAATGVGRWPASCGTSWRYLAQGSPLHGFTAQSVRAEVVPPSPENPTVTLRVLASVGSQETGLTAVYRPETVAAITTYSGTDLHLDELYSKDRADGSSPLELSGTVYTNGRMWLPTGDVNLGAAQLFAEDGFVGSPGNSQARLYTGVDAERPDDSASILNVRSSLAQPLSLESLRASAGRLAQVACPAPGTDPVNYPAGHPQDNDSSFLCLRAGGRAVLDGESDAVDLPATVAAWLLVTEKDKVGVYYASDVPQFGGDCAIACSAVKLARADLAAKTHPGGPLADSAVWTRLGQFRLPASGVIGTDATTYVSHCDGFELTGEPAKRPLVDIDGRPVTTGNPATPVTGPQCADEPDGAAGGGISIQRSMTIVAGTPRKPADLVIAGPVRAAAGSAARAGLVATGSVVVPYFARPAGADLPVAAAVVAFGFGTDDKESSAVVSAPRHLAPADGADDPDYGKTLLLRGSLAAPSLESGLTGFARVQVAADPVLRTTPPPYFPTFSDRYTRLTSTRLSSAAVCGSEGGDRVTTCYGTW